MWEDFCYTILHGTMTTSQCMPSYALLPTARNPSKSKKLIPGPRFLIFLAMAPSFLILAMRIALLELVTTSDLRLLPWFSPKVSVKLLAFAFACCDIIAISLIGVGGAHIREASLDSLSIQVDGIKLMVVGLCFQIIPALALVFLGVDIARKARKHTDQWPIAHAGARASRILIMFFAGAYELPFPHLPNWRANIFPRPRSRDSLHVDPHSVPNRRARRALSAHLQKRPEDFHISGAVHDGYCLSLPDDPASRARYKDDEAGVECQSDAAEYYARAGCKGSVRVRNGADRL